MSARDDAPKPRTVSQEITEKLTRHIVESDYPAGAKLPTERELALQFGVTRHVVREALKRLEAVGVVRIRQGSGIYIENLQLTSGIELFDILMVQNDGSINFPMLRDVLEFRAHMVRTIVRLAATRRTEEELRELEAILEERRASAAEPARLEDIDLRLFRVVAQATHNKVYELMFNTMGRIFLKLRARIDIPLLGFEQTQKILERVVDAFEHKDDAMADLLVARYSRTIREALEAKYRIAAQ